MIGSFFMKNMSSGIIFSEIFGFVGHFFVSFCVSDRLSTCSVSWGVQGTKTRPRRHAPGRFWAPFRLPFLSKIVLFSCCFLIAFLDAFFTDF